MLRIFFISLFLFGGISAYAIPSELQAAEDSLAVLITTMREAPDDKSRNKANKAFTAYLLQTLSKKGAYKHPFKKLMMGKMTSPDGKFRLFNWNLENDDRTHQFYCYVMFWDKEEKKYRLQELKNRTDDITKPESRVLHSTHWFGALYYEIIPVKRKGKKYYMLLGWKGHDRMVTKKVIDVLTFNRKGLIKLGAPLFRTGRGTKKRIVFTYDSENKMSLRYQRKSHRIVFDHLGAVHLTAQGTPSAQVSTLDFDAFVYKKGKWYLTTGIDPRNQPDATDDNNWTEPEDNPFGDHR